MTTACLGDDIKAATIFFPRNGDGVTKLETSRPLKLPDGLRQVSAWHTALDLDTEEFAAVEGIDVDIAIAANGNPI